MTTGVDVLTSSVPIVDKKLRPTKEFQIKWEQLAATLGILPRTAAQVSALLDKIGSTQGDILYRAASAWTALPPGTAGQLLQSGGAAANPSWVTFNALPSIADGDTLANTSGATAIPIATGLSAYLDYVFGNSQGDILYRGATVWKALAPGTSGQVLTTQGAGAAPHWAAGGGGGGSPPTVRGSGAQTFNSNTTTITLPAGTVAGDLAVVFVGHAYGANNPSGWTQLDNQQGSNTNGATFAKVLTSGDITTGSVTVTFAGSYYGSIAIITLQGGTSVLFGLASVRANSGATSQTVFSSAYSSGMAGIYFGHTRGDITVTCNQGTQLQQVSNSNSDSASAVLCEGTPGNAPFVSAATFSFSASGNGLYCAILFDLGP